MKIKRILSLIFIIAAVATVVYFVFPDQFDKFARNSKLNEQISETASNAKELLPGPLRSSLDTIQSQPLTRAGVLALTNVQRAKEGIAPLSLNTKLNSSAEDKTADMFAKQYFEHVSPTGRTPAEVVKASGYEYIVMGENLALGNFKDDEALVTAWMNSPGHRANIMNPKFKEIGIAVRQGTYEGKKVWLAVQHFGTPLSICPVVSPSIKTSIDANKVTLNQLELEINQLGQKLEPDMFDKRGDYISAVNQYNALVQQYNQLVKTTKAAIDSFNKQIEDFNNCLKTNG